MTPPPPRPPHTSAAGTLTMSYDLAGSDPLLGRKRKRKPTQKILEYCLEAEASAAPKKKVGPERLQHVMNR